MTVSNTTGAPVRLAIVGVGNRGESHLRNCATMDDVVIPAVCDLQERRLEVAEEALTAADRPTPTRYQDYDAMLAEVDLDGVIIATAWRQHIPMAIRAMEAGVRPGMDVGPATNLEECWDLVETFAETGVHCMLLENACFRRKTLAVLQMVRSGLFGELVHAECGYCHDLRDRFCTIAETSKGETSIERAEDRFYRSLHHEQRTGDLYPTHGVGPMAECLDINRGNRFVSLTATASKAHGLQSWADRNLPADHPSQAVDWRHGDIITTVLRCANGETLSVTHDVSLPRPDNSKRYILRGTEGMWQDERDGIYVDDRSPDHEWESFEDYQADYEHPAWAAYREQGVQGGHGGSDHLIMRSFVESLAQDVRPPIDAYDAATWMAISPLSAASIERGSAPVEFPDFTSGRWLDAEPVFGLTEDVSEGLLDFGTLV